MPLFVLAGQDRPDAGSLRADTRPRHLAYLETIRDRIAIGGPTLDESGVPTGSIVIAEFEDRESAEAFAAGDPYAEAGLFSAVTVTPYRKVF